MLVMWTLPGKPGYGGRQNTRGKKDSLYVENGPLRVGSVLVLGGVTNEALLISEGDVGGSDTVSLVIGENLNLAVLHHTNTTRGLQVSSTGFDGGSMASAAVVLKDHKPVGGTQINTDDSAVVLG